MFGDLFKSGEWKHYIYWGTAFALVPITIIILFESYGFNVGHYAYGFEVMGIPFKYMLNIYSQFKRDFTLNEVNLLFNPPFVFIYFLLGMTYCLVFKLFMAEWTPQKALHPVAVYLFMPAFSLFFIIGTTFVPVLFIEKYFYYVLWTQFPFYLIYDCIRPFVPAGWRYLSYLTCKLIYFAGLGYVMGFVSMRIYNLANSYLQRQR